MQFLEIDPEEYLNCPDYSVGRPASARGLTALEFLVCLVASVDATFSVVFLFRALSSPRFFQRLLYLLVSVFLSDAAVQNVYSAVAVTPSLRLPARRCSPTLSLLLFFVALVAMVVAVCSFHFTQFCFQFVVLSCSTSLQSSSVIRQKG
jgi:hypothetical protein